MADNITKKIKFEVDDSAITRSMQSAEQSVSKFMGKAKSAFSGLTTEIGNLMGYVVQDSIAHNVRGKLKNLRDQYSAQNDKYENEKERLKSNIEKRNKRLKTLKSPRKIAALKGWNTKDKKRIEEINTEQQELMNGFNAEAAAIAKSGNPYLMAAMVAIKVVSAGIENLKKTVNKILEINLNIGSNLNDITDKIATYIKEVPTYATGSSLITNSRARRQQMEYGLSNAQNYALSTTMPMLGMTDLEDLMYMNRNQAKLFSTFMDKYSAWYERLEASGAFQSIQEFQIDFKMFRQEIAMDFMEWFAEHRDEIFDAVKVIAEIVKRLLENIIRLTEKVAGWFHISSGTDYLSDTMSDYANYYGGSSRSVTININQSNTATGVLSDQNKMIEFFNSAMESVGREIAAEVTI